MIFRSWQLFFSCLKVLREQPTLVIYPVISALSAILLMAIFAIPLWFNGFASRVIDNNGNWPINAGELPNYGLMFIALLVLNFTTNFCNAAFTIASLIRMSGREVSAGEAFRIAYGRSSSILAYSIIGATVGLLLRALQERLGLLGKIGVALVGVAWTVATFLVVPVLVIEDVGAIEGIKRSAALLKRTWGDQLILRIGLGLASTLIMLLVMISAAILVAIAFATGFTMLIIFTILAAIFAVISIAVVTRTMQGIWTAAIYAYASYGTVMPGLPQDVIVNAFGGSRIRRRFF